MNKKSESAERSPLFEYLLELADSSLILGHRLSEWCGHAPVLEQDIALTNIALDLIGQARSFYQYAAEIAGDGRDEDALAYLRDVRAFRNVLLVEQPNGDFAQTIMRQFFYSTYSYFLYQKLAVYADRQLAAIAEKSVKEVAYHVKWSAEWVVRLGDGTVESQQRAQRAIDALWMFTGELTAPAPCECALGFEKELDGIRLRWQEHICSVFERATLCVPRADVWMQRGGKTGVHTEYLGFILAEMQFLQRAYPGAKW